MEKPTKFFLGLTGTSFVATVILVGFSIAKINEMQPLATTAISTTSPVLDVILNVDVTLPPPQTIDLPSMPEIQAAVVMCAVTIVLTIVTNILAGGLQKSKSNRAASKPKSDGDPIIITDDEESVSDIDVDVPYDPRKDRFFNRS